LKITDKTIRFMAVLKVVPRDRWSAWAESESSFLAWFLSTHF